jgi:acetyl/propionyl-CoA carboxylase alpha subunit/acetyl-CoA carboxylase carboxyltransferase component
MAPDFHRIAIVNRGEPAMRLIHAVRELNWEADASARPMRTIALYTEPDRHAMFVRHADEAVDLGPATYVDPADGQRKSAYLNYEALERALVESAADAVWVGWGFVAERAEFVDLCRRLGIAFIGPEANVMRWMGDKIASKLLAERIGVPVAPWSGGPVESLEEARRHAERIGFPLLIKATAGGGGRGIRRVLSAGELEEAFERARGEALRAFGDGTVFLEKVVPAARHVEVQVIADGLGTVWAVGVRDCSVQRRNQKLIEEAPSPALSPDQDRGLRDFAVRMCQMAGYQNAGTVEFLYDPVAGEFYFMEVNTRLQVEHPVTEATTGLDLVKLQIHVAGGGVLPGDPPASAGHAIEVRLNAEDPGNGFAPAPGRITVLRLPTGPGLRIDTGVSEGDVVPAEFDSMIAKIIAHGRDRAEALAQLQRALADTLVVVDGGTTNKSFLLELLEHPAVHEGTADNAWLDQLSARGEHGSGRHADVALLQAAIEVADVEASIEQAQFYNSAARGRPRVSDNIGYQVALRYRGNAYGMDVFRVGPSDYRVHVEGRGVEVQRTRLGGVEQWLTVGERRFRIVSLTQGIRQLIEVDGVQHQVSRDDGGLVRAPSPAVVLSIPVAVGDVVAAGARLVVLEAMKVEMPVCAPVAGRVREILVTTNVQVGAGTPLVMLEATDTVQEAGTARVVFDALDTQSRGHAGSVTASWANLEELRRLMLGFDIDPSAARRLTSEHESICAQLPQDVDELLSGEDELLAIFTDLRALFRRQPASDDPEATEALRIEDYGFTFLRSLDSRGEGLPASFLNRLQRALRHYGVETLDRSPALEESLWRIFKSQQFVDAQSTVILSLLDRRLRNVEQLRARADASFRALLDGLVAVSHGRSQAVCDAAREVRYRYFDLPLFEAARARVYGEMHEHLEMLRTDPSVLDREERLSALVNCPLPLAGVFEDRFATADAPLRHLMLEVLTRRYYRIRDIEAIQPSLVDGQTCAMTQYEFEGKRIHVLATAAACDELATAAQRLVPCAREVPDEHDIVMDFYAWSPEPLAGNDSLSGWLHDIFNSVAFGRPIRRIVVVLAGPVARQELSGVRHFTFRQSPDGYEEERVYRGLHPMMGKRMHMWRLSNFETERLPSVEDVYLFHAVARSNPKDERLLAIAEVRDLTPIRDASGRAVQLPYLERMLMEALAGIRREQFARPVRERLNWNRVLLYIRPPLDLRSDEIYGIMRRLAPATEGLGIEQVVVRARIPNPETGILQEGVFRFSNPSGTGPMVSVGRPPEEPLQPLSEYDQKVVRMRQRGLAYPYEVIRMLAPGRGVSESEFPPGEFIEYDLDAAGRLVPVERLPGKNVANVVLGVIRNFTRKYPEGMTRVAVFGDPSKAMGALAEAECRRINAAFDLADKMGVPLEWFPISAGAKISMESGTENMDWIAATLRRIIEFTQRGGEVNIVVNGINVGAQPYWNAEATMLLHTRGILIMTPQGAMVLTGKQALDYSGSVSAEDNQGIGGFERIMGRNGQAQYWAPNISEAARILFRHYEHTYVISGERFPRRALTTDPIARDIRTAPHGGDADGFALVGDVFSAEHNAGRKRPFDIRKVMSAVIDQDHEPLERWGAMRDAEIGVVWDAHLGGYPVCMIGIESQPIRRLGFLPADGPEQWTAGTLFPRSSKKVARALNAASRNRPVVLLANLSGFDGSPESMRELQLEYGAEIGRAVVNFRGPIVFCVVSRYHGGAYVVFSGKLNENLEIAALEGSFASVIGGAPAAAVVFAGEVDARTRRDPRVQELEQQVASAAGTEKVRLRAALEERYKAVHAEKLGEVADEFDKVHSVQRALQVGSLHHIVAPDRLRPYLIEAVERGIERCVQRTPAVAESGNGAAEAPAAP